jgi:multidrug resistance protein, MATE family
LDSKSQKSENSRVLRWKNILKIAWPLIVANSFWNLQLTIDRIYLGNYSTEALGAAMAVMGVFWTPMALLQQTASYVMTFVAQYFGAQRLNMIGPSLWQALYLSGIGGLLLLLLIPGTEVLFAWIGHDLSVRQLEVDYFVSLCWSALPTAIVAAASGFFTGVGNTKVIMWINCVGLIGNVILDYIMIFGHFGFPAIGIAGAGYATTIATWMSAVYALYLVFNDPKTELYALRSGWKFDSELMKRFIRYGVPSGFQWALEGLAFTVFLIFIGRMTNGNAALASSGIVVTVMMLAVLPALGIAQAVSVLVGQHLGSQNPQAAEADTWSGLQVAFMYIASVGLSLILFPQFYLSWFENPNDPALWTQVSTIVPFLFMYVAFFTCFDSINLVLSFALKGAGDTRFVTFVAMTLPWPLMVFPTWYMKDWNNAVYFAWGAATLFIVSQSMVFLRRFVGGKWKQMSVIR